MQNFIMQAAYNVKRLTADNAVMERFRRQDRAFYADLKKYDKNKSKYNPIDRLVFPYANTEKALIGKWIDDEHPKHKAIPYDKIKSPQAACALLTILHDRSFDYPMFPRICEGVWPENDSWIEPIWERLEEANRSTAIRDYINEILDSAGAERVKLDPVSIRNPEQVKADIARADLAALSAVIAQRDANRTIPLARQSTGGGEAGEAKTPAEPNGGKIVKLTDFMRDYCENPLNVESKASRIHTFVKNKKIKNMPKPVNKTKGHETKLYKIDDLKKVWGALQKIIKSLPNLKD